MSKIVHPRLRASAATLKRVFVTEDPFPPQVSAHWLVQTDWPARWICHPDEPQVPFVSAYRLRLKLDAPLSTRIHISADERYQLFINGATFARGPERGAPNHWYFESFELTLEPGEHLLVARVWSLGPMSPQTQMSVHPGFLLAAEGDAGPQLSTGSAAWDVRLLGGYSYINSYPAFWKGASLTINAAQFPWGFERGRDDTDDAAWRMARALEPARMRVQHWELYKRHRLYPATLPPQLCEARRVGQVRLVSAPATIDTQQMPMLKQDHLDETGWQLLLTGRTPEPVIVPPNTIRRVIIDLEDYYCMYPALTLSGGAGAIVRLHWSEAPYVKPDWWNGGKDNRDVIEGRYFLGLGDTFLPDGGKKRRFETLWWQCGRYIELVVKTVDAPLTVENIELLETRLPLENESRFGCNDRRVFDLIPILSRGIQATSHEQFCDGPFWEEMMYVGDVRLEALCLYTMSRDTRLVRKSLVQFDASRMPEGFVQSRFPSRIPQVIAPYTFFWVQVARDFAYWRESEFVRGLLPGIRQSMAGFESYVRDGLLSAPEGWNFIDHVRVWSSTAGTPPDGIAGISGPINWQYAYTLMDYADLEQRFGEHELAARARRMAQALADRITDAFWSPARNAFADDRAHTQFSEHMQCFAVLSGLLDTQRRALVRETLLTDPSLLRATIYFSHYLFETYRELNCSDALFSRLEYWHDLHSLGLKTPIESPSPRSDCHGWGSHPLFHLYGTVLGIRPASFDFASVEIRPLLGKLQMAYGELVHPRGVIGVSLRKSADRLTGTIKIPEGVSGVLRLADRDVVLGPGETHI